MNRKEIIEAILFSSSDFLEKKALAKYLRMNVEELEKTIEEIRRELEGRPYTIVDSGERVKMALKPEYYDLVRPFLRPSLEEEEILAASLFLYREKVEAKTMLKVLGGKYSKVIQSLINKGILTQKIEKGRKYFVKGPRFSEYIIEGELREEIF